MYKKFFKRLFDLSFTILAIPLLMVIVIILTPIIKLTDSGPVFYISTRIGKNGKLFKMYKFRTMKVNSPDIRLKDGSTYNSANDARLTKIGGFLRKTSLDEIPQLINVLIGNMSLIGPRPDPPDWINRYPNEMKGFLSALPGITGYNQAYFRNSADGNEKMKNDLFYANNISFSLDLKIFIKTFITVIRKENISKETNEVNENVNL